jgi:SAM-dependent methyltransferase
MIRNRLHRESIYCTAEYWDAKALEHEGDAASMWPNNNLNELYYEEIAQIYEQLLPGLRGRKVLEIGCGTGRNTRFLVQQGAEVVGIDFSAQAIERARKRFEGGGPEFRVRSIFALDDIAQYDIALSWGTLTIACRTAGQLADALGRFRRALSPGGRILLLEPIHAGALHRVLAMTQGQFIEQMKAAGFRIDHVQHMHFWPARLALAFAPLPRAVTRPVYFAGQWVMHNVLQGRAGGDYQAILATAAAEAPGEDR